ncbi:MAG: hypothetical protein KZQ77_17890, partial [Candidatus Thiodiazotropha sp. (ex Notomyrtea botanica)]|nr:hypothetical protein [Candidatus Thiodiazotropha sp. (ex Notomyrtea botanica)]
VQRVIDDLADVFISAVAGYRSTSHATVLSDFGQGGLLVGEHAVTAGMADRIGSLESTFNITPSTKATSKPTTRKPTMATAEQQYDAKITEHMQAGMSQSEAVRAIVRDQPDLHRAYLQEYNTTMQQPVESTTPPPAVAAYEQTLRQHMNSGLSRAEAVVKIAHEDPELNLQYVEAYQGAR